MNKSVFPAGPYTAHLREIVSFWLDVVFPPVCALCGRVGWLLCPSCESRLVVVPPPICYRCGRMGESGQALPIGFVCRECRTTPSSLRQMRAPLRYQEPTSNLIHRFKYEGFSALGRPLARFLIDNWPDWEQSPDLLVPIPLHPKRHRRRGYNQSELLAKPLGAAMSIPVHASALRRTRHTIPQVGLGPDERQTNVQGAFEADTATVGGRHVLLIDDVLTTGATMSAAAAALLTAGAADVSAYCLARVS